MKPHRRYQRVDLVRRAVRENRYFVGLNRKQNIFAEGGAGGDNSYFPRDIGRKIREIRGVFAVQRANERERQGVGDLVKLNGYDAPAVHGVAEQISGVRERRELRRLFAEGYFEVAGGLRLFFAEKFASGEGDSSADGGDYREKPDRHTVALNVGEGEVQRVHKVEKRGHKTAERRRDAYVGCRKQ